MTRYAVVAVALATVFSAFAGDIVVSSKLHPILCRMIACPPSLAGDAQRCLANEQSRLDTYIIRDWIRAAVEMNGISLTPAEKSLVEQCVVERRAPVVAAAKHFHQVHELAVRIRRGEMSDAVFADGERAGIRRVEIEDDLRLLPTLAEAERAAARDPFADADAANRRNETQKLLIGHLKALVQERATRQHSSFAAAERELWESAIAKIDMRVVDPRYHLPPRQGVFEVRTMTVVIHPE